MSSPSDSHDGKLSRRIMSEAFKECRANHDRIKQMISLGKLHERVGFGRIDNSLVGPVVMLVLRDGDAWMMPN